jgi:hypothetical protein
MKFVIKPLGMALVVGVIMTLSGLLIWRGKSAASPGSPGSPGGTPAGATPRAVVPLPTLVNPSFAEGGDEPTGWSSWTRTGAVDFRRDTKVFQSAPASLSLVSDRADSDGSTSTDLKDAQPGAVFRVRGCYRVTGTPERVVIGVKMDGVAGQQVGWVTLAEPTATGTGSGRWVAFDTPVEIADKSHRVGVHLTILGKGTVWLDDLALVPLDSAPTSGATGGASGAKP